MFTLYGRLITIFAKRIKTASQCSRIFWEYNVHYFIMCFRYIFLLLQQILVVQLKMSLDAYCALQNLFVSFKLCFF
jgi:hypothetical protein